MIGQNTESFRPSFKYESEDPTKMGEKTRSREKKRQFKIKDEKGNYKIIFKTEQTLLKEE
jgi:hypothetical protein